MVEHPWLYIARREAPKLSTPRESALKFAWLGRAVHACVMPKPLDVSADTAPFFNEAAKAPAD